MTAPQLKFNAHFPPAQERGGRQPLAPKGCADGRSAAYRFDRCDFPRSLKDVLNLTLAEPLAMDHLVVLGCDDDFAAASIFKELTNNKRQCGGPWGIALDYFHKEAASHWGCCHGEPFSTGHPVLTQQSHERPFTLPEHCHSEG